MKVPTESNLVRQILDLLRLHNVFHFRVNAGSGVRPDGRGGWRPVKGAIEGTPDVLAVLPLRVGSGTRLDPVTLVGCLVGIEAKSRAGRQRPSQAAWQKAAEAAGVLYWIIKDVKQLEALLRSEGAIK